MEGGMYEERERQAAGVVRTHDGERAADRRDMVHPLRRIDSGTPWYGEGRLAATQALERWEALEDAQNGETTISCARRKMFYPLPRLTWIGMMCGI